MVESQGCTVGDTTCQNGRGLLFSPNLSSTWSQYGFYALGAEQNLGSTSSALYGNDTVRLGIQGSGGPSLPNQIVAAFSTDDFYLGYFGVNPTSTNFTEAQKGKASYLTTLKDQNLIPSLSFGYTAGNKYRLKQVLGSLTLGGVDSGRFMPNNLSIPFAPQSSRSLLVGIQSISSVNQNGTTSNLLPTPIMALVDSTEAQIWLPVEACQAFEKAFGLTYNETNGFYLVNNALHDQLQAQNASVTFTLGSTVSGGETVNITLPYSSFDLLLTPPAANLTSNTNYFPLRRADNDTQYTLGRTFLQEAYLTVDWERRNFSISECLFSETMPQNLVAIQSPTDKTNSGGSSTGRTVGIAVGIVVGVLVIAAVIGFLLWRRHRERKREKADAEKAEMLENEREYQHQHGFKEELDVGSQRYEMQGSDPEARAKAEAEAARAHLISDKEGYPGERSGIAEASGGDVSRFEVAGGDVSRPELSSSLAGPLRPYHELYDPSTPPAELPGHPVVPEELEGSIPALSNQPSVSSSRRRSSNRNIPGSPLSQSSGRLSLANRVSGRKRQSRGSIPSLHTTAPTPPPKPPASPTPSFRPTSRRVPSNDIYSPLSNEDTMSPGDTEAVGGAGKKVFSPISPPSAEPSRGNIWARLTGKK